MKNQTSLATTLGAHQQWLLNQTRSPGLFWSVQILLLALGAGALLGALAALIGALYLQSNWGPYALMEWVRLNDTFLAQALDLLQEPHRLQLAFRLGQAQTLSMVLLSAFALLQGACAVLLFLLAYSRAHSLKILSKSQDFANTMAGGLSQE